MAAGTGFDGDLDSLSRMSFELAERFTDTELLHGVLVCMDACLFVSTETARDEGDFQSKLLTLLATHKIRDREERLEVYQSFKDVTREYISGAVMYSLDDILGYRRMDPGTGLLPDHLRGELVPYLGHFLLLLKMAATLSEDARPFRDKVGERLKAALPEAEPLVQAVQARNAAAGSRRNPGYYGLLRDLAPWFLEGYSCDA